MPNHVHLLVETGSTPLAKFMQGLQQSYTQHFNRSYRKVGHLFQGRYKAIICDRDKYLLALVRYIHLNPVRAKLATRGEEISRDTEQNEERKAKKPIETTFKEIARRVETTPELLRGKDRRWDISTKRAEAVALLVQDYGYAVSDVTKYLGRDQANISTMLSRLSARQTERSQ